MGVELITFVERVDVDLKKIRVEDCLLRLAGLMDQWRDNIEARLERLEAVTRIDKQTLEEVDKSVRQTWDTLDQRVGALERARRRQEGGESEWGED